MAAFAPGRVNLIGEHTDYNGGLALPFAIAAGVTVTATPLAGDSIEAVAHDAGERGSFPLAGAEVGAVGAGSDRVTARSAGAGASSGRGAGVDVAGTGSGVPGSGGWRSFVRGVVAELARAGRAPSPARLEIRSTLPQGAGLASSAALTVALSLALLRDPDALDRTGLARLCARVENDWVGAPTGLMDQLASLHGLPGQALLIDFERSSVQPVACEVGDCTLVVVDSGDRHAHAGRSGYARRRAECEAACARLGVGTLSTADRATAMQLPEPLRSRALHVVTENERVRMTVEALRAHDFEAVGELLDASHTSLRDGYEVSTPAVERTAAALRARGALGARILGGGFGGNVLALLPPGVGPPSGAVTVTPSRGARLLYPR